MEEDGLFNDYSRQHRPLSKRMRTYADSLRYRLITLPVDQLAELTREGVVRVVSEIRCDPIALGETIANPLGPTMPRRYYAAMALVAGAEFVNFWPDQLDDIEPIDVVDPSATEQWAFGSLPGSPAGVGITTVIELSEEEQRREAQQHTLNQRLAGRVDTARRYVEAIAEQMQRFFDEELVDLGMEIVSEQQLTQTIAENLGFPSSWKIPAPNVIPEPTSEPGAQPGDAADSTDQSPASPPGESTSTEHSVPYRERFDPASFEDVQGVTRIWANSVERYPAAFSGLNEDRISDLLAATLNATLPGAQREVYSRGGKSDIFIMADVLAQGAAPAKVFICESKWATDKAWVMSGVDPQLYGYLTTHDTSAMLLLLFRQQDFQSARSNAYAWLRSIDGYVAEEPGAVEGWPIFVYVHGPYQVRVCVASVAIPPTDPADESSED